jgi:DNA (cytosine-5)-methyltransferase 1
MNDGMAHITGPNDGLRELALFAGAGGGILGGKLLGWRTVCAVEWEPYPAAVLAARQNEGFLPPFPIWDDVQTFDGRPWRGLVDVVSGGFPCQDISAAGKGAGITGERSGMWSHMARVIGEVRPRYALVENSPVLTSRGLDVVLGDLAALGYNAEWGVFNALDAGALHQRERIWILAHANQNDDTKLVRKRRPWNTPNGCHTACRKRPLASVKYKGWRGPAIEEPSMAKWAEAEPEMDRLVNGVAGCVDATNATGNGQVPAVVRLAWHTLHERLMAQ